MENNYFLYNNIIFINPTIKWIIITLPFDLWFIAFSFNYFFYPNFVLFCFSQFFFIKCSSDFFTVKITNKICLRHSVFNFINHKNFFRPISNIAFCKNIYISILNLGLSLLTSLLKSRYILGFTSAGFILMILWYVLLYLLLYYVLL